MRAIEKIDKLKIGHGTHEGMSGKHNEDSYGFFAWELADGRELTVAVVADGIGGQTAGELASSVAVEAVREYFERQSDDNMRSVSAHLERAILVANEAVYKTAQNNPQYKGMGTTMVLVAILENKLYTAYVGDSRIYMLRDNHLQQLTIDHTWAQEAIEAGLLTREQAKQHPNRNVIKRYLGGRGQVEVDHRLMLSPTDDKDNLRQNQGAELRPGDLILLCSDGLTDMIPDSEVHASLTTHEKLQPAVDELIDKANKAGGKDNITVVTVQTLTKAPVGGFMGLGVPLLLAGGALGAILLLLIVGAVIAFGFNGGDDDTTPTRQGVEGIDATATPEMPAGNPATAAVILTRIEGSGGDDAAVQELMSTPGLIPTLRAVLTPSPTSRSGSGSSGATLAPSPTILPTATTGSTGGGGGNTPQPPPPTSTRTPLPTTAPTTAPTATIRPYGGTLIVLGQSDPANPQRLENSPWQPSFRFLPAFLSLLMLVIWFGQLSGKKALVPRPRWRTAGLVRLLAQALLGSFLLLLLFLQAFMVQ